MHKIILYKGKMFKKVSYACKTEYRMVYILEKGVGKAYIVSCRSFFLSQRIRKNGRLRKTKIDIFAPYIKGFESSLSLQDCFNCFKIDLK